MALETITISSDLAALLEAFRQEHRDIDSTSALVEAALREYLRERGYVTEAEYRPLRLTPDEQGSGKSDVSVDHDRYRYETKE